MISNKPRAATIKAVGDSHFATLDRRTFNIIKGNHEKALNQKVDKLKQIPGFKSLTRTALNKYQNYFEENKFIRGSKVLVEGKPLDNLHLVIDGEFV